MIEYWSTIWIGHIFFWFEWVSFCICNVTAKHGFHIAIYKDRIKLMNMWQNKFRTFNFNRISCQDIRQIWFSENINSFFIIDEKFVNLAKNPIQEKIVYDPKRKVENQMRSFIHPNLIFHHTYCNWFEMVIIGIIG